MTQLRISEAAALLGVSDDTVRRWIDSGRLTASTDASNRQVVDGVQLAELARANADAARDQLDGGAGQRSSRNHFPRLVTAVISEACTSSPAMKPAQGMSMVSA